MKLQQVLEKHGIIKEKDRKTPEQKKEELRQYIFLAPSNNFKQIKQNSGLSHQQIRQFRQGMESMTEEEREFVIGSIASRHLFSKCLNKEENK